VLSRRDADPEFPPATALWADPRAPASGIGREPRAPYDARMMLRRSWIAAFIGHVLRRGFADDPDWA
jgi:hypothetical protein